MTLRLRLTGAERGQVLLAVLLLVMVLSGSAAAFIWFMNQQQTRAGSRYRATAALSVAEAGIHRALALLENQAPDGSRLGRYWRPQGYTERVQVGTLQGQYSLSINEEPGGELVVTSLGEVAGTSRGLRVRVYLASPALLAAIFGKGIVKIDGYPSTTFIGPYAETAKGRPWVHVMAGREVWFAASRVSLNDPKVPLVPPPGPARVAPDPGGGSERLETSPIRILLIGDAALTGGEFHLPVDLTALRAFGVPIQNATSRPGNPPQIDIDHVFFRIQAAANKENAAINRAAGQYLGNADLQQKLDSLYSGSQFVNLLDYLAAERMSQGLRGTIYVAGSVTLSESGRLHIVDGTLVAESTVHLSPSAELSITHSPATRSLPALIVLDHGTLTLAQQARLRAHGLVHVNRTISVGQGATFDVVGSVYGNDPNLSLLVTGATMMIRYDPVVLGTPGLVVPDHDPVVAWIAAWEEIP